MGNPPWSARRLPVHGLWQTWVLVILLAGVAGPRQLAAQADPATDRLSFTEPYSMLSGEIIVPSAALEMLLANDDDLVLVALGAFDDPGEIRLDALDRLDAETDGLVAVDAGTSGDPRYWLDLFTLDGEPYGAFTLARSVANEIMITMFLAPVATFADGMVVAQQSVVVDAEPVFDGVDPAGLQALLESALPGLETGGDQDEDQAEPTEVATEGASTGEFAGMPGMIAEGVYVSPHHDVVLTWDTGWEFNPLLDAPVASDLNADVDQVHLVTTNAPWVAFTMVSGPMVDGNFSEVFEASTSEAVMQAQLDPSARVLDRRLTVNQYEQAVGAIIVSVTIDGTDLVLYQELRLSEDQRSVTLLQFLIEEEQLTSSLRTVRSVEFEGGRSVSAYTSTEITGFVDRQHTTL